MKKNLVQFFLLLLDHPILGAGLFQGFSGGGGGGIVGNSRCCFQRYPHLIHCHGRGGGVRPAETQTRMERWRNRNAGKTGP